MSLHIDTASESDVFFTPPSTPSTSSTPVMSDDDDRCSSPSATTSRTSDTTSRASVTTSTSATSISATSISATTSTSATSTSASDDDSSDLFSPRSATTSRTSDDAWSRHVRWLVPPDSIRQPKRKSRRTSSVRSTEHMSALVEQDEDDDAPRRRPASMSARIPIPSPLPVSAGSSSSGYTSLTLPRAAYTPTKHRVSSSVDITLGGLAQTTMATIAIAARPRLPTPAHLRPSLSHSPLAFASHTPPPTKVHSRQVLVQVWAVALDSLDSLIVHDRATRNDGLGFVPGRSFVGRVVESGWDVTNVSRGNWVVGITDLRKCGALAEFIVVNRRRLHTVPRPSSQLSIEQLAILPLAGIPAHRAVRTFAHLPQDARILVLHAHDGPGLLAAQELVAQGRRVVAHVPGPWGSPAERRARDAGAPDVRCGPAPTVLHDAPPAAFDAVLDTLGGKPLWAAARRALRPAGQFTTLVGDAAGALSAPAHFRSTMRALFAHRVGYQWVSPAADLDSEGADLRDSLAAIIRLAADGVLRPHVPRVVPLERAPDALERASDPPDAPAIVVVRIVD